jgi:hypothetical protein
MKSLKPLIGAPWFFLRTMSQTMLWKNLIRVAKKYDGKVGGEISHSIWLVAYTWTKENSKRL